MDSFSRLQELFTHFPGIGPRQAKRFVYYLLGRPQANVKELLHLIEEVRKHSHECSACHRYFIENRTLHGHEAGHLCSICHDKNRDIELLMIVARDSDLETIEKSGAYHGLYFVLGGTVPILDKEPEKRIRLNNLLRRLEKDEKVREVILSLNTTPEGENTEDIVKGAIKPILTGKSCKLTILGRGLSTGAELEYADPDTIKSAFHNRH